jgi:hypothetical protein
VTSIEVFTRQMPSPDLLPLMVAARVISGELDHMKQLTTDVPPTLRDLLTRCFNRTPEQRPTFREISTCVKLLAEPPAPAKQQQQQQQQQQPVVLDAYDLTPSSKPAGVAAAAASPSLRITAEVYIADDTSSSSQTYARNSSSVDYDDYDDLNGPLPPLPPQ